MRLIGTILALALAVVSATADAKVSVSTRYRSPKNPDRRVRASTTLIVLHTTEAPAKGSLRRLSERGEAHYCVAEDGMVYQIVDRHRVAFHAGCSMWNGREDVDDFSIGIECVGYHDKAMPLVQLLSIRALVEELQAYYSIPDENVVTHSMVAYANPNKWQKKKCRGRKRCGMLFAMPSVRRILGLASRHSYDPDVRARRLVSADDYLAKVLYGNTDTMRSTYDGVKLPASVTGGGTGKVAASAAGGPRKTRPSRSFSYVPQSILQLRAQGFESIGTVTRSNLPIRIAGDAWNAPDTYYTIRAKVLPGNILDPQHVEEGMNVWRRKGAR